MECKECHKSKLEEALFDYSIKKLQCGVDEADVEIIKLTVDILKM